MFEDHESLISQNEILQEKGNQESSGKGLTFLILNFHPRR